MTSMINRIPHWLCIGLILISTLTNEVAIANQSNTETTNETIVVGVRNDARPFSYRTLTKNDEEVLPGYGGYMIEICRRVLDSITSDTNGHFSGHQIVSRAVDASDRFKDLDDGKIDILCGPNSITLDRLKTHNASLPLFLSGISFASVSEDLLPTKINDCVAVLGFLANTTAQNDGLRRLAELNLLQLYDPVLDDYLALSPPGADDNASQTISRLAENISSWMQESNQKEGASGSSAHPNQDKINVSTCVRGYGTLPGPIVTYDTHESGIGDLCEGKLLFYVADIDILRYRLENTPHCKNKYLLHHETLTRDAYAVFFRRPRKIESNEHGESALLFSEFNNELQRKMQRIEGILEYEFNREFQNVQPTNELQQFFSAFQFIKDH
ncbi:MAG: transporter substrate-binding domain-containing protein [Granulosicoccus sp.]|nr:transporter substrate-binding domain-containing protein [Granulosicoccus sp.]